MSLHYHDEITVQCSKISFTESFGKVNTATVIITIALRRHFISIDNFGAGGVFLLPSHLPSEDFSVTILQSSTSSNLFLVWESRRIIGSMITRRQKVIKGSDWSPCTFSSATVLELEFWSRAEADAQNFSTYLTLVQLKMILVWGKTRFLLMENEPAAELQVLTNHVPAPYREGGVQNNDCSSVNLKLHKW